mmetsp:Transcript_37633/g.88041  ORF Transcript_37633/g.88041 Transcript_37633/m.88041 type:complete len:233 (-) Transcript_37633:1878-2576(-)
MASKSRHSQHHSDASEFRGRLCFPVPNCAQRIRALLHPAHPSPHLYSLLLYLQCRQDCPCRWLRQVPHLADLLSAGAEGHGGKRRLHLHRRVPSNQPKVFRRSGVPDVSRRSIVLAHGTYDRVLGGGPLDHGVCCGGIPCCRRAGPSRICLFLHASAAVAQQARTGCAGFLVRAVRGGLDLVARCPHRAKNDDCLHPHVHRATDDSGWHGHCRAGWLHRGAFTLKALHQRRN